MAKFSLHIETDDATELAELALRLAAGAAPAMERIEALEGAQRDVAERLISTADEAKEQKRSRGRPPKAAEPVAEAPAPTPQADPVVEAPAPAAAPAPVAVDEAVTYDSLKTLLTEVLKAKSAKEAQDVIRETTGGRAASLTQLSQDDYAAVAAALRKALQ